MPPLFIFQISFLRKFSVSFINSHLHPTNNLFSHLSVTLLLPCPFACHIRPTPSHQLLQFRFPTAHLPLFGALLRGPQLLLQVGERAVHGAHQLPEPPVLGVPGLEVGLVPLQLLLGRYWNVLTAGGEKSDG